MVQTPNLKVAKWEKQPTVIFDSCLRGRGRSTYINVSKKYLTESNLKLLENFKH